MARSCCCCSCNTGALLVAAHTRLAFGSFTHLGARAIRLRHCHLCVLVAEVVKQNRHRPLVGDDGARSDARHLCIPDSTQNCWNSRDHGRWRRIALRRARKLVNHVGSLLFPNRCVSVEPDRVSASVSEFALAKFLAWNRARISLCKHSA